MWSMRMNRLLSSILLALCVASQPALAADAPRYAAWLPYWETDAALDEAEALAAGLDTVVAFAAIFDTSDRPFLLPDAEVLLLELQAMYAGTDTQVVLSVVNDVQLEQDKYENKSTAPLRRLFADEESMDRHIDRLVELVDRYSLDGLEIDYEAIKDDTELWTGYCRFLEKLYEQLSSEGIALRAVLGWDTPMYASLPQGPDYSVMCYNLYGYHSGPGPKADFAFLDETAALYQDVPGNVSMAFATGGFEWSGDTVTMALTQLEAETLVESLRLTPVRDELSGALTAEYTVDGDSRALWYADAETLSIWRERMTDQGFDRFDLFRLGGNNLNDWEERFWPAR